MTFELNSSQGEVAQPSTQSLAPEWTFCAGIHAFSQPVEMAACLISSLKTGQGGKTNHIRKERVKHRAQIQTRTNSSPQNSTLSASLSELPLKSLCFGVRLDLECYSCSFMNYWMITPLQEECLALSPFPRNLQTKCMTAVSIQAWNGGSHKVGSIRSVISALVPPPV